MTSELRLAALIKSVRHIVATNIPGDFVECGVWRGGSMMAIALTLQNLNVHDRTLWLYDTFEGMTSPTAADVDNRGKSAAEQMSGDIIKGCISSFDDVQSNMARTGYSPGRIRMIKGKVEDTIPTSAPDNIALLRLDTDWYESTKHELIHLYPRLSLHGPLIIDDYGHWQGARRAVDEFFATRPILLHYIDYTGRIGIKIA